MLALLILHAEQLGYQLTLSRGYASEAANKADGGHKTSLHTQRLAQDYNLFKDGKYLSDGSGHDVLHDFWDSIGGAPRIVKDLNHYSKADGGMT